MCAASLDLRSVPSVKMRTADAGPLTPLRYPAAATATALLQSRSSRRASRGARTESRPKKKSGRSNNAFSDSGYGLARKPNSLTFFSY